ncbi:hypothetical protein HK100_005090 [Physocladia obscura]|uniref:Uncharacterized protein n=1 Tax=Physocladia obscura TaxID=109957 RepID=A0AAD5SUK8_9FUNG|nr:hypothetical protein HK100_005090 [Physocladia obscura]
MARYSFNSSLSSDDPNEFSGRAQQNVYYQQQLQQYNGRLNTRATSASNYSDIEPHRSSLPPLAQLLAHRNHFSPRVVSTATTVSPKSHLYTNKMNIISHIEESEDTDQEEIFASVIESYRNNDTGSTWGTLRTEFSGSPHDIKIDMLSLGSHSPSSYSNETPEQQVLGDLSHFGPVPDINSLQIDRQESGFNERQATYVAPVADSDALLPRDEDTRESGELKVLGAVDGSFFFGRNASADKVGSDSVDDSSDAAVVGRPRKIVAEDESEISGWSNAFNAATNAPDLDRLSPERSFQKRASIIDRVFSKLQRREKNSSGGGFFGAAIENEQDRAKNSWNVRDSREEEVGGTPSLPARVVSTKRASLVDRLLIRRNAQEDSDLDDQDAVLPSKGKNGPDVGDQVEVSETSNPNNSNDDDALKSGAAPSKRRSIYNAIKSVSANNQAEDGNDEIANFAPLKRLSIYNIIKSSSTNRQTEATSSEGNINTNSEFTPATRISDGGDPAAAAVYTQPEIAVAKRRSIYNILKPSATNPLEVTSDTDVAYAKSDHQTASKRLSIYKVLKSPNTVTSDTEGEAERVATKKRSIYNILKSPNSVATQPDVTSDVEGDDSSPKPDRIVSKRRSIYSALKSGSAASNQLDVTSDREGDIAYVKPDSATPSKRQSIYGVLKTAVGKSESSGDISSNANMNANAEAEYTKPDSAAAKRRSIYTVLKPSEKSQVGNETINTAGAKPAVGSTPSKRLSIYKIVKSPSVVSQAEVSQRIGESGEPVLLEFNSSKRRSIYNLLKLTGTQQQSETLTESSNASKSEDQEEEDEEHPKTPSKRRSIYDVVKSVSSAELGSRKRKSAAARAATGSEVLDLRAATDSLAQLLPQEQELQQEEAIKSPSKKKSWMQLPANKRRESASGTPAQLAVVAAKKPTGSAVESPAPLAPIPSQKTTASPVSVSRQKRSSFFEKLFFRGASLSSLLSDGRSAASASVIENSSVPVASPSATSASKFQRKASHRNSVVFRESLNSDHSDIDAISEEYSEDEGDGGVLDDDNGGGVNLERNVIVRELQENAGVFGNGKGNLHAFVKINNCLQ